MNDAVRIAKAGKLLSLECGEYSSYQVLGFFVVLQDFDPIVQVGLYLVDHPMKGGRIFDGDGYLAWLLRKGFLMEVDFETIHIGDWPQDLSWK